MTTRLKKAELIEHLKSIMGVEVPASVLRSTKMVMVKWLETFQPHRRGFLDNKPCEGNHPRSYLVAQLRTMILSASDKYTLKQLKKISKSELCNILRNIILNNVKRAEVLQPYSANPDDIDGLLKELGVTIQDLHDLTKEEIEYVIDHLELDVPQLEIKQTGRKRKNTAGKKQAPVDRIPLRKIVEKMSYDDKVKTVLDVLAGKVCRCTAKVRAKLLEQDEELEDTAYSMAMGSCISRVLKDRGLKSFRIQCTNPAIENSVTPLLRPSSGNQLTLTRQPGVDSIIDYQTLDKTFDWDALKLNDDVKAAFKPALTKYVNMETLMDVLNEIWTDKLSMSKAEILKLLKPTRAAKKTIVKPTKSKSKPSRTVKRKKVEKSKIYCQAKTVAGSRCKRAARHQGKWCTQHHKLLS